MTASYPTSIKSFSTFVDQTDPAVHLLGFDVTLDEILSSHYNEIHDEIIAIEQTIGVNPFVGVPLDDPDLAEVILDLINNKALGNVLHEDPNVGGFVNPHPHTHASMVGDAVGGDHDALYLRTDGTTHASGVLTAPAAVAPGQLITLAQVTGPSYLSSSQTQTQITAAFAGNVKGTVPGDPGVLGSSPRVFFNSVPEGLLPPGSSINWTVAGGVTTNNTDPSGNISTVLGGLFSTFVQSFIPTKLYAFGPSTVPLYNPLTSDLNIGSVNPQFATIHFSDRANPGLRQAKVSYSWIAIGV